MTDHNAVAVAEGTTLLSYAIQPAQVFVATTTTLTLTITNGTGGPVTFQGGKDGDEIDVTIPAGGAEDALVSTADYTPRSRTDGFTAGRLPGGIIAVTPVGFGKRTLLAGQTIVIEFDNVTVNPVRGTATVGVEELIGDGDGKTGVDVQKLPQELAVIAWPADYVVGLGQPTTLFWQSFGGTMVAVYGFADGTLDPSCPPAVRRPGQRCFPVQGLPPYPGDTPVSVPDEERQATYTVSVYTGDGQHAQTQVTITHHAAVVLAFGLAPDYAQPDHPVGAMETVELQWATIYAQRAYLSTPADAQPRRVLPNPTAPTQVSPGPDATRGWVRGQTVPARVSYGLSATGWRDPASATVTFDLAPLEVAYFKFANMAPDGSLSGITWATDPFGWPAVALQTNDAPYTFTLFQPGGATETRYLGPGDTTHPQVQYFEATPGDDGSYTLTWVTANLTALVLEPGSYTVPEADRAMGTHGVTPQGPTSYVLHATAASGETVTSTLVVTPG